MHHLVHEKNEDRKNKKRGQGEKKTLSAVSSFCFFDGLMLHTHSVDLEPSTCKNTNWLLFELASIQTKVSYLTMWDFTDWAH